MDETCGRPIQRFGASVADIVSQNFWGDFVLASALHEDTRYRRIGESRKLWPRVGYAISRSIVTRADSGEATFNRSNVVGTAMSAGLSSAYYPPGEPNGSRGAGQLGNQHRGIGSCESDARVPPRFQTLAEAPSLAEGGFRATEKRSFHQVPIALRDSGLGLLQTARGLRSLWLPVSPASEVLLEEKPSPPVVAVGKEHPAVEIIKIGGRFRGFEGRPRNGEQAAHQGLPLFNQGGRLIGLAAFKKAPGLAVHPNQLLHRLAIPGFLGCIAGRIARRRGSSLTSGEKSGGQDGKKAH